MHTYTCVCICKIKKAPNIYMCGSQARNCELWLIYISAFAIPSQRRVTKIKRKEGREPLQEAPAPPGVLSTPPHWGWGWGCCLFSER